MLREYQKNALAAIKTNYDKGIRQQLVSMATGSGKTVVLSHIPELMRSTIPGQTLVLAHRDELLDQSIKKLQAVNPALHISKEKGQDSWADVDSDIIVGSVATLGRKGSTRANRFPWEKITTVITDEAHHAITDAYTNIYARADVLRSDSNRIHVGFTATPVRSDGRAMAAVFKRIVYEYSLRRAVEDGFLVEPKGIRVKTNTSLSGVKVNNGDFTLSTLADAIDNPERNQLVVKAWLEHGQNRRTIGFCATIAHAEHLCEMFKHYGVDAEYVWGEDPDRKDKLERHQAGEYPVILNCGVLTEGYDDPPVSCILLARPTKSGVLYCQMIGRGTRLADGKADCLVIDVVDASSKNSLLTLPTLMGMSAELDLRGQGVVWSVKKLEDAAKDYPSIDFTKLEDINALSTFIEDVNLFDVVFPPEVENNSDFSWMPSITGGYMLLMPNKGKVTIDQDLLDKWMVRGVINGQRYKAERDTIEQAFSAADGLITDKAAENLKILRRVEAWHDAPATKAQLDLLAKLVKGKAIPKDLDKGRASKLISSYLSK